MRELITGALLLVGLSGCDNHVNTPQDNKDPRKGVVWLDETHCGFWSCTEASMVCISSTLVFQPANGTPAVKVPNAKECKP